VEKQDQPKRKNTGLIVFLLLAAAFLGAGILFDFLGGHDVVAVRHSPRGVMGTEVTLTAVIRPGEDALGEQALAAAEAALRNVESRMSVHLDFSELSRLNAAEAGVPVELSAGTRDVLRLAGEVSLETDGAFDVTCRPVLELWKRAAGEGRVPTEEELAEARGRVGWHLLELRETGAAKRRAGVSVDLGGIAKGYAVDRAVDAMLAAGCAGGLVDAGGDIRCFGRAAGEDGRWRIAVRDPFEPDRTFATIALDEGAVCTSGNYRRFTTIQGKRYSHIVDPRTGRPAEAAPSVTVVAPQAAVADAWATALSVLGEKGLAMIPPASGIEAMLVLGGPEGWRLAKTAGFDVLLADGPDLSGQPAPAGGPAPGTVPATAPATHGAPATEGAGDE